MGIEKGKVLDELEILKESILGLKNKLKCSEEERNNLAEHLKSISSSVCWGDGKPCSNYESFVGLNDIPYLCRGCYRLPNLEDTKFALEEIYGEQYISLEALLRQQIEKKISDDEEELYGEILKSISEIQTEITLMPYED